MFHKRFASPCGTQFEGGKGVRERSERKVRGERRVKGREVGGCGGERVRERRER